MQGYYSRIHSEIAQLKTILLKTQINQKQQARPAREELEEPPFNPFVMQRETPETRSKLNRPKALPKYSQSPQMTKQAESTSNPKQINTDAILRA